jgi:hypothetical protein
MENTTPVSLFIKGVRFFKNLEKKYIGHWA